MEYSAKFKNEKKGSIVSDSVNEKDIASQKQNDLIFILDQDMRTVKSKSKPNALRTWFNSLGFNNDVKLHLGMKCRLTQGGIYLTIGNSYLSFKSPTAQNDSVFIKNVIVKTFVNNIPVKKGFILNSNSSKPLEDHDIDDMIRIDHDSDAFKNQFLVKLESNQKMQIEAFLSNGERFYSNHFSKKQIEDYTFLGNN